LLISPKKRREISRCFVKFGLPSGKKKTWEWKIAYLYSRSCSFIFPLKHIKTPLMEDFQLPPLITKGSNPPSAPHHRIAFSNRGRALHFTWWKELMQTGKSNKKRSITVSPEIGSTQKKKTF